MNARRFLSVLLAPLLVSVLTFTICITPASGLLIAAPVRLNAPLAAGGAVDGYQIAPDASRLVYLADQNVDQVDELFSVTLGGGTPVRLNPGLVGNGDVSRFQLAADSSTVVYVADQTTDGIDELVSVPIAGGAAVQLDVARRSGGAFDSFAISGDASRVVYLADHAVDGNDELYSVPVGGGQPVRLNGALPPLGGVVRFAVTADSRTVVYLADQGADEVFEVFTVPIAGGVPARVSSPLPAGSDVTTFAISPDSTLVAFTADARLDDVVELFAVPLAGGQPLRLNVDLVAGGDVGAFQWAPDSTRVVYAADADVDEQLELYSITPVASGLVELNDILPGFADTGEFVIAPDSSWVVYTVDRFVDERLELYSVPIAGGTSIRLNRPLPAGGNVSRFVVSPDAAHVVYLADQNSDEVAELYSAPTAGGEAVRLSAAPITGADVTAGFVISADSATVVFSADAAVDDRFELFAAPITGGSRTRLNGSLTGGGDVIDVAPAPDGSGVVYRADELSDGAPEVFFVATLPDAVSVFSPLTPVRIFDTRPDEPGPGPKGIVPAGGTVDVQVGGVGGIPTDASAVVLNVTATDSAAAGFITVWPTGQARPLASSINLTAAGQTRPNLVLVPLGDGGRVSMFSQRGGHLLADATGLFVPANGAVAAGRIEAVQPARVFDTRPETAEPGPKGLVPAGGTITAQVAGVAGVPADAAAAVLNITATEAVRGGFVTVWPAGRTRPLASTLNLAGPGDTTPNLVIMPLGDGGRIELYSQYGAHLLADVTGYVTGAGAVADTSGLFVPLAPSRLFDTRAGEPGAGPKGFVGPGSTITVQIGRVAGVPARAGLVSLNLTGIDAATGFVTAFAGPVRPLASTLNLNGPLDVRANAAFTPLSPTGQLLLFSQNGTHLLADAGGYTLP